jgi:hypothetical protein
MSGQRQREDELLRLLDLAVWGFAGEPQRCSRCNAGRFTEDHSPTCPMPAQVIVPANDIIDRRSRGRVTNPATDQRIQKAIQRRAAEKGAPRG